MPEIGFEYFPSPESDDDLERIAYLYLYLCAAISAWPQLKQRLFLDAQQQADVQRNAIEIFREVRDALDGVIANGDWSWISNARVGERLKHAFGYLALYADKTSLAAYRQMICPHLKYEDESEFLTALWNAEWNATAVQSPAELTSSLVEGLRLDRRNEGTTGTDGKRDPILRSRTLRRIFPKSRNQSDGRVEYGEPKMEPLEPLFRAPSAVRAIDFFKPVAVPFSRSQVKQMFRQGGVQPKYLNFGTRIIFDGSMQKDNPTAWKAIYRKRENLPLDLKKLLAARMRIINFFTSKSATSS